MARLSIFLLGGFVVNKDNILITGFESAKVRALLAYLAAESDRPHRREALATLLWPDWPQQSAIRNLRNSLMDLRKNIGDRDAQPPFLLITRESIQLNREADVWVDVEEFEQGIKDSNQQSKIDDLKSAMALYRGSFLEGFSLPDSPAFEQWVLARRESLNRQALQALSRLAETHEQQGEYEAALPYARRQVELEPWHEPGQQQLMRLLALSGQRSAALAQYEACRQALADGLQVEPSAETKRLYEAIRNEDIQGIKEKATGVSPTPYPLSPVLLPPEPGEPPFKGLQYFDVADAGLFFGREALTARLVGHIRQMVVNADVGAILPDNRGVVGASLPGQSMIDVNQGGSPLQSVEQARVGGDGSSLQDGCCFLAVVGASGSGKSSVVRAGVVPALQKSAPLSDGTLPPEGSPGWHIHVFTPTAHPLESLAISLTREVESLTAAMTLVDDMSRDARSLNMHAQRLLAPQSPGLRGKCRLLLVVDQFEELFTLCRSETERSTFLDNLLTAVQGGGPTQVVVVLRADFYAHCAQYPLLRQALCARQEYIGPMEAGELRRAIEEPAQRNGWDFEPGLVDLILRDIGVSEDHPPEPGALPLLEHALLETWHRRSGRTLTLQGYAQAGGVQGAIAKTAESVFNSLSVEQQALARRIFLRLTELGEGTQDTRRRAPLEELAPSADDLPVVQGLLKILADARLITLAEDTAEVAHEALIREWPTLRQWLSEDREGLHLHRRLTESAEAWEELERDAGELYRGARLAQALEWAERHPDDPNELERQFLQASQEHADREMAEKEAQRQRELEAAQHAAQSARRLARTQRQRSLVLSVGLVIAVVLIGVALWLNYRANQAQHSARAEANNSATQQVRAESSQSTAEAEALIRATLQVEAENQSLLARSRELAAAAINSLASDTQLSLLLADEAYNIVPSDEADSALRQIVQSTRSDITLAVSQSGIKATAYNSDGNLIAVLDNDNHVMVFNTGQGGQRLPLDYATMSDAPDEVAFFPNGRLVVRGKYQFAIYDVAKSERLLTGETFVDGVQVIDRVKQTTILDVKNGDGRRYPLGIDYTDRGIYLATVSIVTTTAQITVTNLTTLHPAVTIKNLENISQIDLIEFDPTGTRMALAQETGEIVVWDLAANRQLYRLTNMPVGAITSMAFSPDGSLLAAAGDRNILKVLDLTTGREILSVNGSSPVFSPDGQLLFFSGENHDVNVWAIPNRSLVSSFLCHPGQTHIALRPDGQQVASAGANGIVHLCEVLPGDETGWDSNYPVTSLNYTPVMGLLGIASPDNVVRIYNAETGELAHSVSLPAGSELKQFAFFRDGARFATLDTWMMNATPFESLRIWDTATGEELLHNLQIKTEAFFHISPDGIRIFYDIGYDYWEYDSATLAWGDNISSPGHTLAAYSPDSTRLALADAERTVSIYESPSLMLLKTLRINGDIRIMAYCPDGSSLAVASEDGQVTIWDTQKGVMRTSLPGVFHGMSAITYSPDGQLLAIGSLDGTVRVLKADTGREILQLPQQKTGVILLAFTPDGRRLLRVYKDGTVRISPILIGEILDIARQRIRRDFTSEELQRYHIASLAPARQAANVSGPQETPAPIPTLNLAQPQAERPDSQVISMDNYQRMVELGSTKTGFAYDLAFAPDGQTMAVVSTIGLSLYDTATLKELWRQKNGSVMLGVIYSPDGSLIATGGDDGHVRVWRAADGFEVQDLEASAQWITSVAFSPDGRLLACSSLDDSMRVWRISDWALQTKFINTPPGQGVAAIQFSSDGTQLAALSNDKTLRFWNLASQKVVRTIKVLDPLAPFKTPEILSVANSSGTWFVPDPIGALDWFGKSQSYSPHGTFMTDIQCCVDGYNERLRIWSMEDKGWKPGQLGFMFWTMGAQDFSPDGKLLALCSKDGTLRLWGVP